MNIPTSLACGANGPRRHALFVPGLLLGLVTLGAGTSSAPAAEPAAPRPNFVFFLVDDLGWGAMSSTGHPYHETPHFDQLCRRGMQFTNAYAACTVCSPSRAAILTGQYPARLHLTDWIAGHDPPQNATLQIPVWSQQIAHEQTTLAEAFQQQGYRTLFLGKWHLMPEYRQWSLEQKQQEMAQHTPQRHGFEVNIGGREWGRPCSPSGYFYPYDMPNLEQGQEGEYLTDRLTDEALAQLDQVDDEQPFLLYLSYYTVHTPLMGKADDVAYFRQKIGDQVPPKQAKAMAKYAAMHKCLDESVGRILAKIDAMGERENTIIIFTGDNGGDRHDACGGLRGRKGLAFEGGVREPTCIVWPGVIKPGSQSDVPIIGMDFYPTMLAMAGLPPLAEQHVDGMSLVPLLTQSSELDRQTLYWHYPHYHRTRPYGAIRHGDWKLIEFFETGELMLFNLASDPLEERNLADAHPEQRQKLHAMLKAWRKQVGAQMPMPL